MKRSPGRPRKDETPAIKDNKLILRTQVTIDVTMWWVSLVNIKTGERNIADPIFVVRALTWQEAVEKIEKRFDREEWPKDIYKLEPQIMEFAEMGDDVAYF